MFEGLVSDLITRICGDYVEGLDKANLNVSVWSGKSETRILRICEDC